ncbi:helix-turn-helix domain-containing protein [Martelella soudanensis]|uniref:helix-turn-helix domain-containing protein n=1 Tax=unclassified Martelella TaxID=2629616 RepID=UPI0015DE9A1D|nr:MULTISPECIES: AraC family transcriptional regulator [unclassified Martelella]
MTFAAATLKTPVVDQKVLPAGPVPEAFQLVMQALLLMGDEPGKALEYLSKAQSMMEMAEGRSPTKHAAVVQPGSVIPKGGLAPWQISKVRCYIDENIDGSISLCELAGEVDLSVSYFSAAFKVSFGLSPHAFVIAQRVEKAKRRIALTDTPLCEIALDCGLADQAHLSRVFRRHTGFTPSGWRRACSAAMATLP